MARHTYVWRGGQFLEIDRDAPRPARKGPYIRSDSIEPTKSQIDGNVYTSKSDYYRHVRETGHEILGNDCPKGPEYEPVFTDEALKEGIEMVKAGKGIPGVQKPAEWED